MSRSISDSLEQLDTSLDSCQTSLQGKEVEVEAQPKVSELPALIDSIQAGGGELPDCPITIKSVKWGNGSIEQDLPNGSKEEWDIDPVTIKVTYDSTSSADGRLYLLYYYEYSSPRAQAFGEEILRNQTGGVITFKNVKNGYDTEAELNLIYVAGMGAYSSELRCYPLWTASITKPYDG